MTKRNAFFITLISLIISSCDTNKQNTDSTQSNESMFIDAPKIQKKLAPSNAKVFFLKPSASETISGPVKVEFGVDNIEIVPSGQDTPLSGHHHIIINADLPNMDLPIPADENYVHFGDGSSKTTLNLEKGEHTLQLILGDYLHIPHDPPIYSEKITIIVE